MLRPLGFSAVLRRVRLGSFSGLCVAGSLDVLLLRPCVLLWLLRALSWLREARLRPLLCLQRLVVVLLFPLLRVLRVRSPMRCRWWALLMDSALMPSTGVCPHLRPLVLLPPSLWDHRLSRHATIFFACRPPHRLMAIASVRGGSALRRSAYWRCGRRSDRRWAAMPCMGRVVIPDGRC